MIKEINEQVWKPFIRSFSAGDDEGFKAGVYFVRVINKVSGEATNLRFVKI